MTKKNTLTDDASKPYRTTQDAVRAYKEDNYGVLYSQGKNGATEKMDRPFSKRKESVMARKKKDSSASAAPYTSSEEVIREYDPDLLTEMEVFNMKPKKMSKALGDMPRPMGATKNPYPNRPIDLGRMKPKPMSNDKYIGNKPRPVMPSNMPMRMSKAQACPECGSKINKRGLCKCGTMGKAMIPIAPKPQKPIGDLPRPPRGGVVMPPRGRGGVGGMGKAMGDMPARPRPGTSPYGNTSMPARNPADRPTKPARPKPTKPDMGIPPLTPMKPKPQPNRLSHTMGKAMGDMPPREPRPSPFGSRLPDRGRGGVVDKVPNRPKPVTPRPYATPNMPMRMSKNQGAFINGKKASVTKKK